MTMTVTDAVEHGLRIVKYTVHCNMCGEKELRWMVSLQDESLSVHKTQGDAMSRLIAICENL